VGERIERAACGCWSDAGQELQGAKARDAVAAVFAKAQEREHVLDVRGFEKAQAPKLDEWNIAPRQLDFERPRVMRSAKQYGLRFERDAAFPVMQNSLDDEAHLRGFIGYARQKRPLGRGAIRTQVLGEPLGGKFDHRIGGGEDRPRRAVVMFESDHLGARAELAGKVED